MSEVPKEFVFVFVKKTTEAEADVLNMLSKTTEKVEDPMEMEMIEGDLKMREGALGGDIVIPYTVAEVAKEN